MAGGRADGVDDQLLERAWNFDATRGYCRCTTGEAGGYMGSGGRLPLNLANERQVFPLGRANCVAEFLPGGTAAISPNTVLRGTQRVGGYAGRAGQCRNAGYQSDYNGKQKKCRRQYGVSVTARASRTGEHRFFFSGVHG